MAMVTSLVWILAGITAWCVAALALALIVGPLVRRRDRVVGTDRLPLRAHPATAGIPIQLPLIH